MSDWQPDISSNDINILLAKREIAPGSFSGKLFAQKFQDFAHVFLDQGQYCCLQTLQPLLLKLSIIEGSKFYLSERFSLQIGHLSDNCRELIACTDLTPNWCIYVIGKCDTKSNFIY